MQTHRIEHVEFFGGPLDGHIHVVSLPTDELNDVAAIPVNQNVIEMLGGHRAQQKGPATSIAVYVRQDDRAGGQYHFLRSATPRDECDSRMPRGIAGGPPTGVDHDYDRRRCNPCAEHERGNRQSHRTP
ncbi:MAG: hypothetical protein R3E01_02440 [Pirellulaceae bacterium]|nr:hypothetical protein [Planctomycetales bacterium]